MKYFLAIINTTFCLLGVYSISHAEVKINEIAWMGTVDSTYEEWIELYNTEADAVSLKGWKILKTGDVTLFEIKNEVQILGEGYFLICRTTTTLTNPLGGICNAQGSFGGSGLNNTQETLTLKDESGNTLEILQSGNNWSTLGGKSTTKETAQKTRSGSWITAIPTPGEENSEVASTTVREASGSTNSSTNNTSNSNDDNNVETKKEIILEPTYSTNVSMKKVIIERVPVKFSATITKTITKNLKNDIARGKFEWSMGDGQSYFFERNTPITYTYQKPGEYVVILKYYESIFDEEPKSIYQKIVTVIPATIGISVDDQGVITLTNTSTDDIDLLGWSIVQNYTQQSFSFKTSTILRKGTSLTIPNQVHGLVYIGNTLIQLITPDGYRIPVATKETKQEINKKPVIAIQKQQKIIPVTNTLDNINENLYQTAQMASITPFIEKDNKLYILLGVFVLGIGIFTLGFHKLFNRPHKNSSEL